MPGGVRRPSTSKEMWSLPTRISSSCLPSLFLVGHFASSSLQAVSLVTLEFLGLATYFIISLSFTMRLISSTTRELTNTAIKGHVSVGFRLCLSRGVSEGDRTLFPDQAIVPVVRVVRIAGSRTTTIANDAKVELYDQRVSEGRSIHGFEEGRNAPRNSCPKRP